MFRSQGGRPRGRPSRAKRLVSPLAAATAVLLPGDTRLVAAPARLFDSPFSSARGSRRGDRRGPSGLLVGDASTTAGLVTPSEVTIAPRSTGLTSMTLS